MKAEIEKIIDLLLQGNYLTNETDKIRAIGELNQLFESQLNEEREKNKNLVELLNRAKGWFSGIQDKADKINTGNISHQKATIIGFAKRCREFLTLRCREFLTLNHK
jgi:hypothetical protein